METSKNSELDKLFEERHFKEHFKLISDKILTNPSEFFKNYKSKLIRNSDDIRDKNIRLKSGEIINIQNDKNFIKIYELTENFMIDFLKEISIMQIFFNYATSQNTKEIENYYAPIYNLWQKNIILLNIMKSLHEKGKGLTRESIKQINDYYHLIYESLGSILESFAKSINKKQKIRLYKNKPCCRSKGDVYYILQNFNNGEYKELFDVFDPTIRNAISHPGPNQGVNIKENEEKIEYKDKNNTKILTYNEFNLRTMIMIFFLYSSIITINNKLIKILACLEEASKEIRPT